MNKSNLKSVYYLIMAVVLSLGLSVSVQGMLAAWQAPIQAPPNCTSGNPGCDEPINIGSSNQTKAGVFGAGGLVTTDFLSGTDTFFIDESVSQNIGIKTLTPDEKLDVVGRIAFGDTDAEKALLYRDTGWLHIQNLADTYDISLDGPLHVRIGGPSDIIDELTVSGGNFKLDSLLSTSESFFKMSNGTEWGLMVRSDGNSPKIGASESGELQIYPYANSAGTLDSVKGPLTEFDFVNMRVGIGTANPERKLTLSSGGDVYFQIEKPSFLDKFTLSIRAHGAYINHTAGTATDSDLYFRTNDINRMVITDTGNVGIGNINPGALLDVSGTLNTAGSISVDGNTVIDDAAGWHRTYGNTGWYNQTWGGGWYMGDANWIRTYGSKNIYHNAGIMRTDGTLQVGSGGGTLNVPSGGNFSYRTNVLFANTAGNVGIGTAAPGYKLHVNGSAYAASYAGGACDIAERYDAIESEKDNLEPGDIVAIDKDHELQIKKSDKAYDTMAIGIYSTKALVTMGTTEESNDRDNPPVALLGRVPTKVTDENGPIEIGDNIVSSSKSGYGMRCDDYQKCQGAIVGKALQRLENGEGVIKVMLKTGF